MLAQNYGQDLDPLERLADRRSGVISVYALNRDYHDVVKGKLKRLAQWLAHETKAEVKVFVDTAPLMEKPLAQKAGLGWQGKHTNLVSRELGSWFFIGAILTTAELERRCAGDRSLRLLPRLPRHLPDRTPFPRPTSSMRGAAFPTSPSSTRATSRREFRARDGQPHLWLRRLPRRLPVEQVCRKPRARRSSPAREDLMAPRLAELLALDDAGFRALFSGSPVKRTGRDRFIRNVLIAAGNSGDAALVPQVEALLADASPLVRAMAVWACRGFCREPDFARAA